MLNNAQIDRMLSKLRQLETTMDTYAFTTRDSISVKKFETNEHLYSVPNDENIYSIKFVRFTVDNPDSQNQLLKY